MRLDMLSKSLISLGPDALAVVDQNDNKSKLFIIHIE